MPDLHSFKPLRDGVLVRRMEKPRNGGLIVIRDHPEMVDFLDSDITGRHQNNQRTGMVGSVVAVGPGRYDEDGNFHPTVVKPGQVIYCTQWDDLGGIYPGHVLVTERDIW